MPEDPTKIQRSLSLLDSGFRKKLEAAIKQANTETLGKFDGIKFFRWSIFETYRTPERQKYLYAKGRTLPGDIVTNVKTAGLHGKRLAADVVWIDTKGNWRWDGPEKLWAILGHCARAHGLIWGGDWEIHDTPHIQMKV